MKYTHRLRLLFGGISMICLTGCGAIKTAQPIVKDISLSVYAPGRIIDPESYDLKMPVSGILKSWKVSEGDTIDIDQVLGYLDGDNQSLNAQNASIRLEEARRNLERESPRIKEAEFAVQNALLSFRNDSTMFARQEKLWRQGIGSKVEYESRKLSKENSEIRLKTATKQLENLSRILNTEFLQAQNLYRIAQNQRDEFEIRNNKSGVVRELLLQPGELALPQTALVRIGGMVPMRAELLVDEVDVVLIHTGQTVVLRLDAYPDEIIEGKIDYIVPSKGAREQSYRVEVVFGRLPGTVLEGMTIEGNILIEERKAALLVPQEYVLDGNQVIVEGGDTITFQPGISDLEYVQVLEGDLNPESILIKP